MNDALDRDAVVVAEIGYEAKLLNFLSFGANEKMKIENIYKYVKGRADKKIGIGRPAVKAEPEKSASSQS